MSLLLSLTYLVFNSSKVSQNNMSNDFDTSNFPRGDEAIQLREEVVKEARKALQQLIDRDVQLLKEKTLQQIKSPTGPDEKGYYHFKFRSNEIRFKDIDTVIDHYYRFMEQNDYIIPKIPVHKSAVSWLFADEYHVSFRPKPKVRSEGDSESSEVGSVKS